MFHLSGHLVKRAGQITQLHIRRNRHADGKLPLSDLFAGGYQGFDRFRDSPEGVLDEEHNQKEQQQQGHQDHYQRHIGDYGVRSGYHTGQAGRMIGYHMKEIAASFKSLISICCLG